MIHYKAPLRDARFVMEEVLDIYTHYQRLGLDSVTQDLVQTIAAEGARFAEKELSPLNAKGDEIGCRWDVGEVTTPPGFKEAYRRYREGGWPAMIQPARYGGQELPFSLFIMFAEWVAGANHSWAMYPGLSQGCIETLKVHGTEQLRQIFLPKLIDGRWTGTMCLTESHCGSDLGLLKTKAVAQEDGSYRISGTKIFISAGEHDLSENIIHIVLARLPDAPEGTKGISLFVVPKYRVDSAGHPVARNSVFCGSIEHKMGIKASATCVMNFEEATGYLIGAPHRGLNCMFTFMNAVRINTGVEGLAASDAAFQGAYRYACDRLQMRSLRGTTAKDKPADPIIVHPDVRRMLLTQKAFAEGNRVLAMYCAQQVDIAARSEDADLRAKTEDRLAFLTPIVKAFLTETAQECTSYGMQVYGGHGFIKEWGMEQLARDTRISTLYEGTTGIQALDLLSRKVLGSGGRFLQSFIQEAGSLCSKQRACRVTGGWAVLIQQHLDEWQTLSEDIGVRSRLNPDEVGAASVDYLMYSGYVVVAWCWLQIAVAARQALENNTSERDFYSAKLKTARFYFERILPRTRTLVLTISSGADNLTDMSVAQFNAAFA